MLIFLEMTTASVSVTSLCTEYRTEAIVFGMEAIVPHSSSRPKPSKPWFNTAC